MKKFFFLALTFLLLQNPEAYSKLNALNGTGKKVYKATKKGDTASVNYLLTKKNYTADELLHKANYKDRKNRTPLIIAAMKGYHEIAKILMKYGGNPTWKDSKGMTAEDYAYRRGDSRMKEIVRNSGNPSPGAGGVYIAHSPIPIYNHGGFSYKACQNHQDFGGHTIPFKRIKKRFVFLPECAPDVLYSWKKGDKFEKRLFDPNHFLEVHKTKGLYAWRTPMGTYGYGDTPVRMKLKPNVKFVLLNDSMRKRSCSSFSQSEKETTVYISYLREVNAAEYLLCSDGPVESWSLGIPEVVTEVKREKSYIERTLGVQNTHKALYHDDIDTFIKYKKGVSRGLLYGHQYNYLGFQVDKETNWRKSHFRDLLRYLEADQQRRRNFIKYAPGVKPDRSRHLKSKYFSYYTY